ncbi:MAG: 4Fe-4S binding protein [Pseudomonadota bacterium]
MTKALLLCSCEGTQTLDREALVAATGLPCARVADALCTRELGVAAEAMRAGEVVIACGQEAGRFADLAEDLDVAEPTCVDVRDRAGWSDEGADATAKVAALLSDGQRPRPAVRLMDITSEGVCLVIGRSDVAIPAAERLSSVLSVTCLITDGGEGVPDHEGDFDIVSGRIRSATGALGRFALTFDDLREAHPGGRGARVFAPVRDGATSSCDVLVDLTGGSPLFPAAHKRDGYLRSDPGRPDAVAEAVFEAAHLVGTFEKPLYVRYDATICAHGRAGKTACTNCLDICPTGAITSAGEAVEIDPNICAGCGACAALCPSGAVSFDDPPVEALFARVRNLAEAYRSAGGRDALLLIHDDAHGAEMIRLAARHGRGLPAHVVPMDVRSVEGIGHAELLAALGSGFAAVDVLLSPRTDRTPLDREVALADALGATGRLRLIAVEDPDGLSDTLYDHPRQVAVEQTVLPVGGRREVARLAAGVLSAETALPLPSGAPYGAVLVDTEACTLCLSCSSLCPSGALTADEDYPRLRFQEDACLQCGLCASICPEAAITLAPRMTLTPDAFERAVVKEEEPAACISCGKAFGVKSTIERIVAKLEGVHPMFTGSDNAQLIRMCDDCRVQAQYHSEASPFRMGERPRVRTTADDLAERDEDS